MHKPAAGTTSDLLSPAWRRALAAKLLAWFDGAARDLPWRQTRDLYAIWVSEVMLQQTQVATVIGYYQRFLARFPDVQSLAAAEEHLVLRMWEGLGYYRRARQLHAAARTIVAEHAGRFPTSYEAVRSLPGIGRYTAGAILSIGTDARLPILEANTIRVLSRLSAYCGDPTTAAGQKRLWTLAEAILPAQRVGAFNQALMELGSAICTPQSPGCDRCPVAALCEARRRGLVKRIPRRSNRTRYEDRTEAAVVIRRGDRVLIRQCQPGERWAGLWDFPRVGVTSTGSEALATEVAAGVLQLVGMRITALRPLATLKHGVTRFRITLQCFEARPRSLLKNESSNNNGGSVRWVLLEELTDFPLSVTGRKISHLISEATTLQKPRPSASRRQGSRHAGG